MTYHISIKRVSVSDMNIKNHTYCFFDDMINIKNIDLKNIRIDGKPYRKIFIHHSDYVTPSSVTKMDILTKPIEIIFDTSS